MQPLWYRNSAVYAVDPVLFNDSDGDGWGDLRGLTQRLDHVRGLGATCLWLLPFYTSPFRDGGYDVNDHLAVDPRLGDLPDFVELLEKAEEIGLRVIIDLVFQHTSDQHPWFQEARRDRTSPYRDYYVWADEPHETDVEPIFPTVEDDVWTWDEEAQQYYRHVFYRHEPDLNLANPRVREEMYRVMAFWLRLGVSGFRVDAVPYMVERAREADPAEDGRWLLREMRDFVSLRRPNAVLIGEVDVPIDEYDDYFADGQGLTMLLDFWLNNHLFLALARSDGEPLARALREQPPPPRFGQYANWLRHHDELDLERLGDADREEVMRAFAPERSMRAYGRGIRRRLAPILGGDERRILMAHALMLSLPGTPLLYYGEEIGMGDELARPERLAVRTPMQWSDDAGAGFSTAPPERLAAPLITGGRYGHERVNVYAQTLRHDSLLSKTGNLVRTRLGLRELGLGRTRVLDVGRRAVLALRHDHEGSTVITVVNLSADDVEVKVPEGEGDGLVDVLADTGYPPFDAGTRTLGLSGYGYRWLRPRQHLVG
ncbi:maltose alpha-D-glucosyltransferase/alpha-amylase [Nocardiopsis arvandica]|uniref:Maltose alpha-D-glucosyltransferase/alpha-amylase n=1 Tax=Nocardiopsis sinuspersici TaxID=501010 RepID=A0A7Y9XEA8_9ACTN|nr:alpha-amylase family protein [Nocardiopsis sinuspersici]NYH53200.1 maltose alpha-D-glucosyltransferase/alpha-amylase [Nocardiopsis sinuspersici]